MTNFARSLARVAGITTLRRRPARIALIVSIASLASLLAAPVAGAVVKEVSGTTVGLQPRTTTLHIAPEGGITNLEGNPMVQRRQRVRGLLGPAARGTTTNGSTGIDNFLHDLGAGSGEFGSIFSTLGQYRDRSNAQAGYHYVYKGSYTDTAPYPPATCTDPEELLFGQVACVTDAQIREQLQSFIATHKTEKGMHAIYYVLTPPGVAVCLDEASTHCSDFKLSEAEREKGERKSASYKNSFCSYHGAINPGKAPTGDGNTILYAAIPWSAAYEGHPFAFIPGPSNAGWAYDCQDGGWNPENGEERPEELKKLTKEEKEAIEELEPQEREEKEIEHALTGPHIQEPNQDGKGEEGDYAQALFDPIVNQIAVEQANMVTNPLLTSWQDRRTGSEATDECRNTFAGTAEPSEIGGSVSADIHTEAGTIFNELIAGDAYYVNNVANVGELHYPRCVGGVGLVARFNRAEPGQRR